ncbi:carbohydrate ABC transporter permease [Cohnella endophytica]|uniref:Carbohydrate ABC transporter permease n=1 Tax=Cohnella endophytica TaxID=2419778 RepID=A0A494X941_9BACL|nr:carbohydrate ABC transporter permease [Cohnella endophytica]RKP46742.1 carbohydrate ABC transporter permease [Cohnella endophytica]
MTVRMLLGKSGKLVFNAMMLAFSVACVFPIAWIVYSSLKTKDEFMLNSVSLPHRLQFHNYYKAFVDGKMYQYFISSALNTVTTVVVVVFLSFCVAYALSRFRFKWRNGIYSYFIVGMLIPVYGLIVPLYLQFKQFGLYDKFYTLFLPYIAIRLPLPIFLLESFIRTVPAELDEAAHMDGASTSYLMTRILLPICKPAIATIVILTFLDTWNEFPFSLVLVSQESLKTLPVGLTNFYGQFTSDYTTLMAAMVLSILPVMAVYLAFYKNIIQGMTAGAVKG